MKATHILASALAVVLATGLASADETRIDRQIAVTGDARIAVTPTLATITLGVTEEADEAALAMSAVSTKMVEVVDELRAAGIAAEDMQTQQISLNPVWSQDRSYDDGRRKITGFSASNTLALRIRDLDRLGEVLDQVLRVGANDFRGLSFGVADPAKVQDQIRGAAVKDALRKATQLAEAAGVELGPVRSIHDRETGGGQPMMAMEMARSAPMPIEAGELSFSHSVSVVYDITSTDAD
ncbi:SIMPL domain-containing protein [Phaeobacter sp. JH20_02]|uniref:SIMPL domain-containing protein n=1 Tax=unclassified Phaeobacter TaxID=2621772 RepID=UPI003A88944E